MKKAMLMVFGLTLCAMMAVPAVWAQEAEPAAAPAVETAVEPVAEVAVPQEMALTGKIAKVNVETSTVAVSSVDPMDPQVEKIEEVLITETSMVTKEGAAVTIADLKEGDAVAVQYVTQEDGSKTVVSMNVGQ